MRTGLTRALGGSIALLFAAAAALLTTRELEAGSGSRSSGRAANATSSSSSAPPADGVTLVFAGDVYFEGTLAVRLRQDPSAALAPARELLADADVTMANLETAVTEGGAPEDKDFTFRAPGSAFVALRDAGVDVVTMANNHGLDYGPAVIGDATAAAAGGGVHLVGIGPNRSAALAPAVLQVRQWRLAFFGAADVLEDYLEARWTAGDAQPGVASAKDLQPLIVAVTAARPTVDTVVVFLHWGVEGESCPTERQREVARRLAAAGADVIVGSHAHRVQGAGRLGGALVSYGLGNFAFGTLSTLASQSGALEVQVVGRRILSYRWRPAVIEGSLPRPLRGESAARAVQHWADLRACTDLAA